MEKPRFSIIVPVYNVKEYLKECMESLISQTFLNYEIILIDDGSTDGSSDLCDLYKGKKTHVIHQHNNGLSAARNEGIKNASGDYLLFVDSDDYISINALEKFSDVLEIYPVDILYARAYRLFTDGRVKPKKEVFFETKVPINGIKYYEEAVKMGAMSACAPFSICKREWFIKNNLFFESGILHEDELWAPRAFYMANSVLGLNDFFYYHRIREGSITQTMDIEKMKKNGLDLIRICLILDKFSNTYTRSESRWLRNNISMLYKSAVFHARLDQTHKDVIDRSFPIKNAFSIKERAKSMLFFFSPTLYCCLDDKKKRIS